MAFNFNWSPLTADADFYSRARDLLTKALNKSPKPPIIVDDILVSELNLGTVPPDLEILEIGDLAEDRFRGIFKMTYSGDAYLTLKTRVQANPLNTYLYSKPSFTSPQPLAAASGLTIPLSITLSEIRLSAFIILVFSKQKGLTLVFRNDPLESLKVSSTFDSIQFVRDYLQRTIEQQLRNLMMDELPAIIHRLSLQLWCPDQAPKEETLQGDEPADRYVDPFAIPPADPVDSNGQPLDPSAVSEVSLNGGGEIQSLFSQKNLLRLSALTDSHRTLSLFTPSIHDVVFRAWSGPAERSDCATPTHTAPGLTRTVSFPMGSSTTYTFSDSGSASGGHLPSRPSQISLHSASGAMALGARSRPGRKRKTRVVNLRRSKSEAATPDTLTDCGSDVASIDAPFSDATQVDSIPEDGPLEIAPPLLSTGTTRSHPQAAEKIPTTLDQQIAESASAVQSSKGRSHSEKEHQRTNLPTAYTPSSEKSVANTRSKVALGEASSSGDASSVILEQAWIMKMAGEIAQRVYDEKRDRQPPWDERDDSPPPAYEATA